METLCATFISNLIQDQGYFRGEIQTEDEFAKFIAQLRDYGFYFVVRNSHGGAKERIYFKKGNSRSGMDIPFIGHPFCISKRISYQCSMGPKKVRTNNRGRESNSASLNHLSDQTGGPRMRTPLKPSRKMDCQAGMEIWKITLYSEYTLDNYKPHGSEVQKEIISAIKRNIDQSVSMKTEERIYIRVAKEELHNHDVSASAATQDLRQDVKQEIYRLVENNLYCTKLIKQQLKDFYNRSSSLTSEMNSGVFPSDAVIRNHMRAALKKKCSYDQDAVEELIKQCTQNNSTNDFEPLPQDYLNNSYFIIDTRYDDESNDSNIPCNDHDYSENIIVEHRVTLDQDQCSSSNEKLHQSLIPIIKGTQQAELSYQAKFRELSKKCFNISYHLDDEDFYKQHLPKLEEVLTDLEKRLPASKEGHHQTEKAKKRKIPGESPSKIKKDKNK